MIIVLFNIAYWKCFQDKKNKEKYFRDTIIWEFAGIPALLYFVIYFLPLSSAYKVQKTRFLKSPTWQFWVFLDKHCYVVSEKYCTKKT